MGRSGSARPARERRIASETAVTASSWPMTRVCSRSSSPSSRLLLLLGQAAHGHAGLPRHDLGDVLRGDLHDPAVARLAAPRPASIRAASSAIRSRSSVARSYCSAATAWSLSRTSCSHLAFQVAYVGALGAGAQPDPGARLVDQVDRLVRKVAVGEIAVRQLDRREQRLVRVAHLVVGLVAVLQPAQNLDRVGDARLGHEDRLEAAGERRVLLDVAPVLLQRGGADDMHLAAGQGRLEHVARLQRPALRPPPPAPTTVCSSSMKTISDSACARTSSMMPLQPLLEVTPVAGAGDDAVRSRATTRRPARFVGHVPVGEALGQALDDRGLAHPRVTDQHGVVLAPAGEHLDGLLDLLLAADDRVDPARPGQVGQVAAVLVQGGRVVLAAGRRARVPPVLACPGLPCGGGLRIEVGDVQDAPGCRVRVGGERVEHMLGTDVRGPAPAPDRARPAAPA